jgi:hypothetical protein
MSRQDWSARPFNPSNEPGTCLWCGRKLTTQTYKVDPTDAKKFIKGDRLGVGGDGYFCTLVDGYSWAVTFAALGQRMVVPKKKQAQPCSDCVNGYCDMNCGPAVPPVKK